MKPNKPAAQLLGFYGAGQPFEEQQLKYTAEDEDWRPRPQRRGDEHGK